MRACLLLCAALALAPSRPRAAASHLQPQPPPAHQHQRRHQPEPRLEHIKTQILAKLGLSSRPTPLGAPPRDVVRQILARAADPQPEHLPEPEHSMREIIAIAHRDTVNSLVRGRRILYYKFAQSWDAHDYIKIEKKRTSLIIHEDLK